MLWSVYHLWLSIYVLEKLWSEIKNFILIYELKKKIIFTDLKIHDIPNTCASTVKAIKYLNANYLTIHISSGLQALKEAKKYAGKTKLVGVTILTSLDNKSLKEIGFDKKMETVLRLIL